MTKATDATGPTQVMGVLNVTPDSFSDGGKYLASDDAVQHGLEMVAAGAQLVDVGGESTRPGAVRTPPETELERVIPVVARLADAGTPVSVDTMRSEVARAGVAAGAVIINDVSGGLADPRMLATVAEAGVDFVCQHWRGPSATMATKARYRDVVAEVRAELLGRVDAAVAAGVARERIIIDPGLGFAKTGADDWELLRHLEAFTELGYRVLVGASRKRFLGAVASDLVDRDTATSLVSAWCAQHGIWAVRVHDVRASAIAVATTTRLLER